MLLFLEYIVVASLVVYCSIKASQYIDMLDKMTSLSGAFLGGVMLSAVTSLPELFTSVSATLMLHKPSLCIGNILGSNLFNLAVLALCTIASVRHFRKVQITRGNILVTLFVLVIYVALLLNMFNFLNLEVATVNIVTLVILALYVGGVRYLANEDGEECEECTEIKLTKRQVAVRFVLTSIAIIALSITMTYITDDIASTYNIGMGLAGAIFLGVATSLPEVSSTIALFRLRNYNIAVGNIVGSNLFNFLVLCIADVMCLSQSVYDFSDVKVVGLLEFGMYATLAMLPVLRSRNTKAKIAAAICVVVCYIAFLVR